MAGTISQRISLEGSEDIRKKLEELGKTGEEVFKKLQQAAAKPISDQAAIDKTKQAFDQLSVAVAKLGPQFKQLTADTEQFGSAGEKAAQQTTTGLNQVGAAANTAGVRIGVIAGVVAAAATKLLSMVGAMRGLTTGAGETAQAISKQADTLQLSIGQWLKLRQQIAATGGSAEDFVKSAAPLINTLSRLSVEASGKRLFTFADGTSAAVISIAKLSDGTKGLIAEFAKFGVSLDDLRRKSPVENLTKLATTIAAMPEGFAKTAAGIKFFDAGWRDAVAALTAGKKAITDATSEMDRQRIASRELTEKQVIDAKAAADQWEDFAAAIRATKDQIGALFAGASFARAKWLTDLVDDSRILLQTWLKLDAAGRVGFLQNLGEGAAETAFKILIAVGEQLAGIWSGVLVPAGNKLLEIVGQIAANFEGVSKSQVAAFFITAAAAAIALGVALKGIAFVLAPIAALLSVAFTPFGAILIALAAAAVVFWDQLVAGAKTALALIPRALEGFKDAFQKLFAGDFSGFWNQFSAAAVVAFEEINQAMLASQSVLGDFFRAISGEGVVNRQWVQDIVNGFRQIATELPAAIKTVVTALIGLGKAAQFVADSINKVFGTEITATAIVLLTIIGSITGGFVALAAIVTIVTGSLGLMVAALGGIAGLLRGVGGAAALGGLLISAKALLVVLGLIAVALIAWNWDAIREGASRAFNAIVEAAKAMLVAIGNAIGEIIVTIGNALAGIAESVGTAFSTVITSVGDAVGQIIRSIGTAIETIITSIGDGLAGIATAIGASIGKVVESIGTALATIPTAIGNAVAGIITSIGTAFGQIAVAIGKAIGDVIISIGTALAGLATTIGTTITSITSAVGTALSGVGNTIGTAFGQGLSSAIGTAIETGLQTAIAGIGTALQAVPWAAFQTAGTSAMTIVGTAITTLIGTIQQLTIETQKAIQALAQLKLQSAPAGGGGGAPSELAHGGLLGGRGTGTSDSNLAWVSRGEHIMPARAVRQPGVLAFLEALRRSGGNLRRVLDGMGRFALGGLVRADSVGPAGIPAFAAGGLVPGAGLIASVAQLQKTVSNLDNTIQKVDETIAQFPNQIEANFAIWKDAVEQTFAANQSRMEQTFATWKNTVEQTFAANQSRMEQTFATWKDAVEGTFAQFVADIKAIAASGHASGGLLGGRGTGTSDSNLAWVSRGEHIMPARAVRQPGVLAFLEALRLSGGNLTKVLDSMGRFALGGLVSAPAYARGGSIKDVVKSWDIDEMVAMLAEESLAFENRMRDMWGRLLVTISDIAEHNRRMQMLMDEIARAEKLIFELIGTGPGAARGGLLGGRGTGTSDSNLAWVSRGEHIMPARAVRQPGVLEFLEALRLSGGNLRRILEDMGRFALGGMVRPMAIPAFASGGLNSGMSNVTIQFPGLDPISGLRASSDTVEELRRAAAMAQVRSGGRKPSRYT